MSYPKYSGKQISLLNVIAAGAQAHCIIHFPSTPFLVEDLLSSGFAPFPITNPVYLKQQKQCFLQARQNKD
jgi:hypothetical protein